MQENKFNPLKILKFSIVGGVNTLIDFGLYNLLFSMFGWWYIFAHMVSFATAVTNSYFLNKYWTWQDRGKVSILQFSQFFVISLAGLVLSIVIIYLGVGFLNTYYGYWGEFWRYNVPKVISVMLVWVWNYLAYEYFIFGKSKSEKPETNGNNTNL
ncbi:MAG: GtrA family protein [Patescibacteria group bacterium]|nr:GtrA family protein [Patescibacteria group bacterium]